MANGNRRKTWRTGQDTLVNSGIHLLLATGLAGKADTRKQVEGKPFVASRVKKLTLCVFFFTNPYQRPTSPTSNWRRWFDWRRGANWRPFRGNENRCPTITIASPSAGSATGRVRPNACIALDRGMSIARPTTPRNAVTCATAPAVSLALGATARAIPTFESVIRLAAPHGGLSSSGASYRHCPHRSGSAPHKTSFVTMLDPRSR